MKNFKLIIFVFSILLALPYSSFAQKQLVKTVYKGVKGLFKREAKVLTKEGIEATNKSILKMLLSLVQRKSVRTMSEKRRQSNLLEVLYARTY